MRVDFLAIAETELVKAVSYYNGLSEGLGDEFALEVKHTITRILRFPEAWASLSTRTSRCCTKRFPYGVVYQVRGDTLLIVSIMHLHRHPDSWKSRLRLEEQ
jgi:hypothetical protein